MLFFRNKFTKYLRKNIFGYRSPIFSGGYELGELLCLSPALFDGSQNGIEGGSFIQNWIEG